MFGLLGFCCGCAATALVMTSMQGGQDVGASVESYADGRSVWLVLFEPRDKIDRAIDKATGGLGYSHVAIEAGELDGERRSLLIDCAIARGVTRVHCNAGRYEDRPRSSIELTGADGGETYGAARARIGLPYGFVVDLDSSLSDQAGLVCSQFVAQCLPRQLRQRVLEVPARGWLGRRFPDLVTPNRLAEAFGVVREGMRAA